MVRIGNSVKLPRFWKQQDSRCTPHYGRYCIVANALLLSCLAAMEVHGQSSSARFERQPPVVYTDLGQETQESNSGGLRPIRVLPVSEPVSVLRPAQEISLHAPDAVRSTPGQQSADSPTADGIKRISELGIDITAPVKPDTDDRPLPMPEDFASDWRQRQPRPRRDPQPEILELRDEAYGASLNFCYQPLYFEETDLERYGKTAGVLQPLVSASHFYGSAALLPFRLMNQPCHRCTYHHHPCRPGGPPRCECQHHQCTCQ